MQKKPQNKNKQTNKKKPQTKTIKKPTKKAPLEVILSCKESNSTMQSQFQVTVPY